MSWTNFRQLIEAPLTTSRTTIKNNYAATLLFSFLQKSSWRYRANTSLTFYQKG